MKRKTQNYNSRSINIEPRKKNQKRINTKNEKFPHTTEKKIQ